MDNEMLVGAVEALLFAAGKPVSLKSLCEILEKDKDEVKDALQTLEMNLIERKSGIQLVKLNDAYQLATLEVYYDYVCKLLDNRPKPTLSQAALEVLAIVAYNPKVTRAEMEKIRGVSSDSAMNKLLEYNLIEEAGRMDAPGRPMMYQTTDEFLKMFGYTSLKDLPDLPKLKEEIDQLEISDDTENQANEQDDSSENLDVMQIEKENKQDGVSDDLNVVQDKRKNNQDGISEDLNVMQNENKNKQNDVAKENVNDIQNENEEE